MKITSTSITEGQPIELAYAHADAGGKNINPQLSWTPGPEGTKSYAITIYDPDAPHRIRFLALDSRRYPGRRLSLIHI